MDEPNTNISSSQVSGFTYAGAAPSSEEDDSESKKGNKKGGKRKGTQRASGTTQNKKRAPASVQSNHRGTTTRAASGTVNRRKETTTTTTTQRGNSNAVSGTNAASTTSATARAPAPPPAPTDPRGTTTNTASGSASANHDGTIDAAQIRVPGFLTASGNPVNVNQSAAWEHQCQLRRYRLLAEHQAASIEDAHADDLDGNRRLTELDIRMNNEIGLELGYSGINIVLGDIEPLEYEIDEFHHPIREDYYRTAGQVLLDRFARFLPSFHVPCMVFRREEPLRLLKPREKPTGGWNGGQIGSDAAQPQQQQHTGDRADGTQQQPYVDDFDAGSASAADPGAAPGGGVAASTNIPPAGGVASVADPGAAPGGDVAAAASNTDNNSSTERATADTVAAASASASSLSTHNITTTNTNNTSAASTSSSSTRITATPLPPPTGFRYEKSSKQSSTDPSDCAQLFNWSKMVRNEWNTYLLLKEVISKKDVDSKSIAAIKALNSPHLYYHICNNLPVTVIIVLSYAPFGLYEGSPLHKCMELFFQGVSFLVIDLCPIIAPGGVGILGRKNNTETILGQTIHNKIMTMLERILRVIRDGNRAIIVGFGDAARHSGNMADIIGNYHARHPCTIYAGVGNIDTDYDALVLGAKLQMKLFGTDDQHEIEKWLHSIKFEIMSTNRAFTQDTVNVAKKIEQSRAWNRIGMHIDYNFKPLKITTNFWLVDEIKELLQFCIAQMFANEVNGKKNIKWSLWENFSGSDFTRTDAQKKIVAMLTSCYGRNKPRTREQFESLLDNLTVVR